ncbi:putative leucine-rich repeat-containing protein DDB_G0290503 [Pogonomyrmex barbatus]|uniref:Leucine-rich repeat-containing protein DDB_G0290503 n=1 Tax=Pogonomyrmex barbatus TaxID=144034 RepID=A0A6I9WRV9_9HYME|nr:putative leucine-rich repeat-containing protein DDB_G0290503 [Pogonomyrmex barbatus]
MEPNIESCYNSRLEEKRIMQEEKARTSTQGSGKFINSLIGQWISRTGSNVPLQAEEQVAESSSTQSDKQQASQTHGTQQSQENMIQILKRKLKESRDVQASLTASLETEVRNKEEIQTKLNATWIYIENITEYYNYIKESLASFQQHRDNLSTMYDNVILKQQEAIQKLQLNDAKSKDLENHVAQLRNKSLVQEERLQEALAERNKLRKQLENELQLQRNELANAHAEEKLKLVKEEQRLLLEYENLQSRLQTIEKEKSDIAKSTVQLENKLLLQEEKLQEALMEQNKLRKQVENAEREFLSQKNELANAHIQEKKMLVEKQQRLQSESESLRSQLNILEQDKSSIIEIIAQKDELISKFQNEISMYKNQIDSMTIKYNETYAKCEALIEKQNIQENELLIKTERIKNIEAMLNAIKQREAGLVKDVNRIEKKLFNEMEYSKNLENKLSIMQKDLQIAQKQNIDIQQLLEKTKNTNKTANLDLQLKLTTLEREKEEIIKQENMKIKNAEILYENMQIKHAEEVSALKSNYETQLSELKKNIDYLNEMISSTRKENSVLNKSLTEMRVENTSLKNKILMEHSEDLQGRLKEVREMLQTKSVEVDRKITSESTKTQYNVSTSLNFNDSDEDKPSSQALNRAPSIKRQYQNEQEAEVTSMGKKFFKSRSVQPRTYAKRRKD